MARGATHVLGLDIGTQTIKAVELRLRGQEVTLIGRPAVIPTPPGSVVGGRVVDEDAVTQAILDAAAEHRFGVKKVIASVGGDTDVVVRIAEMPRVETRELDEAVRWELDRQTQFPIEQVIYDFKPIEHPGTDPAAPNMEVFLAVALDERKILLSRQ
jgi:type IV pilus assembly protein PilM